MHLQRHDHLLKSAAAPCHSLTHTHTHTMCDEFVRGKGSCAITCRKAGGEAEEEGATAGVDSTLGLRRVCAPCVLLQCVAGYCSVVQCVAVCCSVLLQCVAGCCSVCSVLKDIINRFYMWAKASLAVCFTCALLVSTIQYV